MVQKLLKLKGVVDCEVVEKAIGAIMDGLNFERLTGRLEAFYTFSKTLGFTGATNAS